MLVNEFSESCQLYTGFQIWEIESINAFFAGNQVLATIFNDHYGMPISDLDEKRAEIEGTDLDIMTTMLQLVDDKSFFIFTLHEKNHLELVKMQKMKIMNFGVDIEDIKGDRVYVVIMDKKK